MRRPDTRFLVCLVVLAIVAANIASAEPAGRLPIVEALRPGEFSLLTWDQMQAIKGPEDRVHGLASLVECNFTYAGFPRAADLKACEALKLKAIVYPDAPLGLTDRKKQLTDAQIESSVRRLVEQTRDSPACAGYFIIDEPSAPQFPYLGKIVAAIRKHAPEKLAYINLLPSYATPGQLGTKTFSEYLERYVKEVKPQFLSYDNYMVQYSKDLRDRKTGAKYFQDLVEVRRVALEHNLPFWNVISCVQIRPGAAPPSPANLLLQAWTTLCAGGQGVSWYKYKEKEYEYRPIDASHKRTMTWTYLQMVNGQLKVIGPIVAKLKSVGVYFAGAAPLDQAPQLPGKFVKKLDADEPLMIGEFASQGDEVDHLMLVNLSLERTARVKLKDLLSGRAMEDYSPQDGHLAKVGPELDITAGQGVLLKLSPLPPAGKKAN